VAATQLDSFINITHNSRSSEFRQAHTHPFPE
jgi:hypothetical protein